MNLIVIGVISLLVLGTLSGIGYRIHHAGYTQGKVECEEAAKKQREKEEKRIDKSATKLEKDNAKARVVYRTITKTIDKYIDRPVYRNVCLDADGVRDANIALTGARTPASEPNKPLSKLISP
jgi:hypothetical protein